MRVEIPTYAERWKRGDKYGEVVKTFMVKTYGGGEDEVPYASVKLDWSGEVLDFPCHHCNPLGEVE